MRDGKSLRHWRCCEDDNFKVKHAVVGEEGNNAPVWPRASERGGGGGGPVRRLRVGGSRTDFSAVRDFETKRKAERRRHIGMSVAA
jgi:hypothetical protein